MVNDDLISRLQRLYAAIGATEETDISKFVPQMTNKGNRICFYQDWSGGLSNAERANYINSLISNIASLEYHLYRWADDSGHDKTKVRTAFNRSQALKIIHDLWNNDKHGYNPERRGHSGKSPRVERITSFMQMTTKPEKGSFVRLTFNCQGAPRIAGTGTAKVIITGDILDRVDNKIGDFYETALEAIGVWESVLRDFGIKLSNDTPLNI